METGPQTGVMLIGSLLLISACGSPDRGLRGAAPHASQSAGGTEAIPNDDPSGASASGPEVTGGRTSERWLPSVWRDRGRDGQRGRAQGAPSLSRGSASEPENSGGLGSGGKASAEPAKGGSRSEEPNRGGSRSIPASGGSTLGGSGSLTPESSGGSSAGTETGGFAAGGATTPDGPKCPPVCGPSYETLFDNRQVGTLNVYIEGDDLEGYAADDWLALLWSKWKHCPPFDNLVRSRMVYDNGTEHFELSDVGMRLRGSREQPVQGFKLDFQKLLGLATGPERRRFGDINRLNILSIEGDDSHLLQCLAYDTLRQFGVEAPRCNHLRVYVNDRFYGLLEQVEEPDHGRFLRHHFGTSEGLLVEASPSEESCGYPDGKADLEYNGDTFSGVYTEAYKIERGTVAELEQSLLPMFKCGDPDTTPDDQEFEKCISEWLDVDEWLRVIAFESLTPELESFVGYKRNYYLYFHPDPTSTEGGRFLVYPWDLDTSFHKQRCYPSSCNPFTSVDGYLGPRGKRAALVTRLTKVYEDRYCALMQSFVDDVFSPSLLDELARVVEPAIEGDPNVTIEAFQIELGKIRSYIEKHQVDAGKLVASSCQ